MKAKHTLPRPSRTAIILLGIAVVLVVSACQPLVQARFASPTPAEPSPQGPTTPEAPVEQPTPPIPDLAAPTGAAYFVVAPENVAEDVLRFTFPTPGPAPVSLWRPPLYEIPWALGAHDHFYFARPMAADVVNWPLSIYRYGDIFPDTDIVHTGIDIPNPRGTPVIAAGPGRVIWAGYGLSTGTNDPDDPYGLAISIRHDFGYKGERLFTVYAHLDRIDVVRGQRVITGEPIGVVGNTGHSTGPHLHFEVRLLRDGLFTTRNPELWLAPPQGWGVLVGRMMNSFGVLLIAHTLEVQSMETGQKWSARTYGSETVNSDDYYQENLVLSDLPAGDYQISARFGYRTFTTVITIHPGAITYFAFNGRHGFDIHAIPLGAVTDWSPTFLPQP